MRRFRFFDLMLLSMRLMRSFDGSCNLTVNSTVDWIDWCDGLLWNWHDRSSMQWMRRSILSTLSMRCKLMWCERYDGQYDRCCDWCGDPQDRRDDWCNGRCHGHFHGRRNRLMRLIYARVGAISATVNARWCGLPLTNLTVHAIKELWPRSIQNWLMRRPKKSMQTMQIMQTMRCDGLVWSIWCDGQCSRCAVVVDRCNQCMRRSMQTIVAKRYCDSLRNQCNGWRNTCVMWCDGRSIRSTWSNGDAEICNYP